MTRFYVPHALEQCTVVVRPIGAGMNAPMAVWTKRNHKRGVIGPAIADPTDMMGLQVRAAIGFEKRGRRTASLAVPSRTSQHINFHITRTLVDISRRLISARRGYPGGLKRSRPEFGKRRVETRVASLTFHDFLDRVEKPKLKNNRVAKLVITIWRPLYVVSRVDHLALEPQSSPLFLEKQQASAFGRMVGYGSISAKPLHVPELTFSKILEHAIFAMPVCVAIQEAFLTGDYDHNRVHFWRDNSTLLLASKPAMDFGTPIVDAVNFESPRHKYPPYERRDLTIRWFGRIVGRASMNPASWIVLGQPVGAFL
jgi:hypothetical protein